MQDATPPTQTAPGFEVINSRRLPFPRADVFDAFADPEKLVHWWGPHGFTNHVDAFDLRPGGDFCITMVNENQTRFENIKRFTEVVVPERVVFRHLQPMHDFTMTMLFAEADGATDLIWRMVFVPGSDDTLQPFLQAANEQNFDRLEAFLRDDCT